MGLKLQETAFNDVRWRERAFWVTNEDTFDYFELHDGKRVDSELSRRLNPGDALKCVDIEAEEECSDARSNFSDDTGAYEEIWCPRRVDVTHV